MGIQIPNSFSRMATFLSEYFLADCKKSLGMVKSFVISISFQLPTCDIEFLRLTQIGLDHIGIFLNLRWSSFCDHLAKIKSHYPMGNIHYHPHVVLNQNTGRLP